MQDKNFKPIEEIEVENYENFEPEKTSLEDFIKKDSQTPENEIEENEEFENDDFDSDEEDEEIQQNSENLNRQRKFEAKIYSLLYNIIKKNLFGRLIMWDMEGKYVDDFGGTDKDLKELEQIFFEYLKTVQSVASPQSVIFKYIAFDMLKSAENLGKVKAKIKKEQEEEKRQKAENERKEKLKKEINFNENLDKNFNQNLSKISEEKNINPLENLIDTPEKIKDLDIETLKDIQKNIAEKFKENNLTTTGNKKGTFKK